MQFAPLEKKERASFREMLVPADGAKIGSAAALFAISALAIPFAHIEAVAGLYLLYAVIFYYSLTRSLSSILALAVPGAALYGISMVIPRLPQPYMLPAIYAALILGPVAGSFLLVHCREKRFWPLLLLPVATYLLPAILLSPLRGLLVLFPLALGLVLGYALLTCTAQTTTLLRLSAVLAIGGAGAYLIWFFAVGAPGTNPLSYLGVLLRHYVNVVFSTLQTQALAQGVELPFSASAIANVGVALGNVLPGTVLALCAMLSFGIYRTHLRVFVCWGTLRRVPIRLGALTVTAFTAFLFVFSYVASLVGGLTLFGTVCENLVILLQPALFLIGITSLLATDGGKRSMLSTLLLIGLLFLLWMYTDVAISVTALIGAVRVLIAAILTRRKKSGS